MATKTSAAPEFMCAVADGLKLRLPAWQGVQIASAHLGAKVKGDFFFLIGFESSREPVSGGGAHTHYDEEGMVAFELEVERNGGGEDKAREVLRLSAALLADLEKFLVSDQGVGGLVMQSNISTVKTHQYMHANNVKGGRGCLVQGQISFKARLTPGG